MVIKREEEGFVKGYEMSQEVWREGWSKDGLAEGYEMSQEVS
jgi:hypothetical protein